MADHDRAIDTSRLTKYYGRHRGIEDVSLSVERGEVFGLLGPNGAGKTTTIRLLLDFLNPTGGSARVLGMDSRRESVAIRRRVGYLQGDFASYADLTPLQLARYFSSLRGSSHDDALRYMQLLDLEPDRPFGTLSKGNRQKVGLVQALMSDPELLALDEPTAGLDPLMQRVFRDIVAGVKSEGRTVFLSSHDLAEAESLCDRVAVIRNGRVAAVESIDSLRSRAMKRLEIEFAEPVNAGEFARIDNVREVSAEGRLLVCVVAGEVDSVVKAAARHTVVSLTAEKSSLEDTFMAFYEDGDVNGSHDAQ